MLNGLSNTEQTMGNFQKRAGQRWTQLCGRLSDLFGLRGSGRWLSRGIDVPVAQLCRRLLGAQQCNLNSFWKVRSSDDIL